MVLLKKKNNSIVIIQKDFPPYRKAIFDKLSGEYDFTLLLSNYNKQSTGYQKKYVQKIFSIQYYKNKTNQILFPFLKLIRLRPRVVVHEFSLGIISLVPTMLFCKLLGIKFLLWGHGYNFKKKFNPHANIESKIRYIIVNKSNGLILYDEETKNKMRLYFNEKKLFVAKNTIDTETHKKIYDELSIIGRQKIRTQLGFDKQYNLLYIGRLLPTKHPELLLKLYTQLNEMLNGNICIHVVGDGPMYSELETLIDQNGLEGTIKLYGAIYDLTETGKMLFASDFMIIPGALGLSVNHAFCYGCPVVSFKSSKNGPFHGPEANYITQNETGLLTPNYDIDKMAHILSSTLIDKNRMGLFRKNTSNYIYNECSLNIMFEGFRDCFNTINN